LIGNFITISARYNIPYSDNYLNEKTDYLMAEIWKNGFFDLAHQNLQNMAKNLISTSQHSLIANFITRSAGITFHVQTIIF